MSAFDPKRTPLTMQPEPAKKRISMDSNAVGYARVAIATTIFFFVVMFIAFLFIQPEFNPLHRYGSEYAVGRMGWLMKLNFYV